MIPLHKQCFVDITNTVSVGDKTAQVSDNEFSNEVKIVTDPATDTVRIELYRNIWNCAPIFSLTIRRIETDVRRCVYVSHDAGMCTDTNLIEELFNLLFCLYGWSLGISRFCVADVPFLNRENHRNPNNWKTCYMGFVTDGILKSTRYYWDSIMQSVVFHTECKVRDYKEKDIRLNIFKIITQLIYVPIMTLSIKKEYV